MRKASKFFSLILVSVVILGNLNGYLYFASELEDVKNFETQINDLKTTATEDESSLKAKEDLKLVTYAEENGLQVIDSSFDVSESDVKTIDELSPEQTKLIETNIEEINNALKDNVTENELGIIQIIEPYETELYKVENYNNDIVADFGNFKTYVIDNEYISVIPKESMARAGSATSTYPTKLSTSYTTNKEWFKLLDGISVATAMASYRFPAIAPVAGQVSLYSAIISIVGKSFYATLYKENTAYRHKTCPYKTRVVSNWYQKANYTYYLKQTVRYKDGTNTYQRC